jgi:type IV pilus assembly protein PilP
MRTTSQLAMLVAALSLVSPACGGDDEMQNTKSEGKPKAAAPKDNASATAEAAAGKAGGVQARTFRDSDFVESESNRDPFRSVLSNPKAVAAAAPDQRPVLMPNTPIASVKLIAIITGIAQPRAMMVDEKGVGYVATRGDFVGQAEVVQSGAAENLPVTLNWRVDRIRENEVVLAREDPTGPNRPPLTKVLALHTEEDKESGG